MPAPYSGDSNQYPANVDCPVDADPPNAWATTHPLQQLADRTGKSSYGEYLRGLIALRGPRE